MTSKEYDEGYNAYQDGTTIRTDCPYKGGTDQQFQDWLAGYDEASDEDGENGDMEDEDCEEDGE